MRIGFLPFVPIREQGFDLMPEQVACILKDEHANRVDIDNAFLMVKHHHAILNGVEYRIACDGPQIHETITQETDREE